MLLRDIFVGQTVYHRLFVHRGPGTVKRIREANGLERMFERGSRFRVDVLWFGDEKTTADFAVALRSKPNKKKIAEMIEFYRQRDVKAYEVDGRLVIERNPVQS